MLAWVMNDAGLSLDDLARVTGRPASLVEAWLAGEARPQKGDAEKIARSVRRSIQFLLLPEPPETSPLTARFRAAIAGQSADPVAERAALREAQRIQQIARWGADEAGLAASTLPPRQGSIDDYAATIRQFIGWRTDSQFSASKTATFKAIRAAVEARGIVVLLRPMGAGNCRGFSLPDERAPLIAINADYRLPALRTYTLLHELAHLAAGTIALCHDEDTTEERWCNAFAASFLMPEESVRSYFDYHQWTSVTLEQVPDRIRLTSNRYSASWQSVAIRLRALGLAQQDVVDHVFRRSGEYDDAGGWAPPGSRTRPVIRLEEYGTTFTRAVIDLRRAERLSELDARRYLKVNGTELGQMRLLISGAA